MVVPSVSLWLLSALLVVEGRNVGYPDTGTRLSWSAVKNGTSSRRLSLKTTTPPEQYIMQATCKCTKPGNCEDSPVTLKTDYSYSSEEDCEKGEVCCNNLLDEREFNDVDENEPLGSEFLTTPKPTPTSGICKSGLDVKPEVTTEAHIISAHSLLEEDSEEVTEIKTCGVQDQNLKIIPKSQDDGSHEAYEGEFPWTLILLVSENGEKPYYHCVATLLGVNLAVTAAHCVSELKVSNIVVRAGEWDVSSEEEEYPHQDVGVSRIVVHESYDRESLVNDIALLYLSPSIKMGINIKPLCLPNTSDKYNIETCKATGWGPRGLGPVRVNPNKQRILKKVNLKLIMHKDCQNMLRRTKYYGSQFVLHKNFVCGKAQDTGDTCLGDGGAPLFCRDTDNPRYVLVGITSWGDCSRTKAPGAYVNVNKFTEWILDP